MGFDDILPRCVNLKNAIAIKPQILHSKQENVAGLATEPMKYD